MTKKASLFVILCIVSLVFMQFHDVILAQPISSEVAVQQLSDGAGSMSTRAWHSFSANLPSILTVFLCSVFALLFGGDIYRSFQPVEIKPEPSNDFESHV